MQRASPEYRLYLLGSFRLESRKPRGTAGRETGVVNLATRKVESLLAYLALFPQTHPREQLAALLWGDVPDTQARHSLRTALAAIRKELGQEILIADRETIQLNPDLGLWVDAREFEQAAESQDPNGNEPLAISHYSDLLPDFYDDWIIRERERLRTIYLDALLQLAQHYRSASDYARAIETAQIVLGVDRANEKAHQHLMFCFAAQGDRIAALKQYDECKKILRDELNAEPSSETTALRDQVLEELTGAPSPEAALTNLPNPLTSFVGREKEIKELKELLPTTRLLTLSGAGGCGKTRLAIQIGREFADANRFRNGVWWVDLSSLTDPELIQQKVASAFDLRETADTPFLNLLINYLHEKELLLVVDNCEHLVDPCAKLFETLLSASPKMQIVATSREALRIAGEMVWRVPSLPVPDVDHLPPLGLLAQYDAVRLFVQRAATAAPNWKLNGNAPAVALICSRLEGIPLAIELAAARLKALSADQIAARLGDRFQLLTSGSRTALLRQQTLRATMNWSFDLLSDEERALLRRLSVFAGGWSLEAAEALVGQDGILSYQVLDLLTNLVDKSLILIEEQGESLRYRMLETIRQYTREKLEASGETAQVRNQHLDYFMTFAEAVEPKLRGPEQMEWLDRLDLEHDNLRDALEWSLGEGRVEKGLRLAAGLTWFWDMRAYWSEGRARTDTLLIQPEAGTSTLARANVLFVAAHMAARLGERKTCYEYFDQVIAIARKQGKSGKRVLAQALGLLSEYVYADNPVAAESLVEEGLAAAQSLGDEWVLALLLYLRGELFVGKKDHRAARMAYEESLGKFNAVGDRHWAAVVSISMSRVLIKEREFAQARRGLEESLRFFRQAKSRPFTAYAANLLGEIARAEGRDELAKVYYVQMLEIVRELGAKFPISTGTSNLGFIALHNGEINYARSLFAESLTLARDSNYQSHMGFAIVGFASVAAAEKRARRAVQLFAFVAPIIKTGDLRWTNPADEAEYDRYLALARQQLDEAAFNSAWQEGRAMTLEQAVEYALENLKTNP